MATRAAVVGASGYAGGELLRLLLGHPGIELGTIAAGSSAGQRIGSVHPNLPGLADQVFETTHPGELAEHDVVFLALPHGQSAGLVAQLPDTVPVVDLGADFRLREPAHWSQYYGGDHAGSWTYGLAELPGHRVEVKASGRVANPGCYPTAVALAAAPIVAAGLADATDVVVVASSGTSGAGRGQSSQLMGAEVMGSLSAYKTGGAHQHTPEMEQS
ncbi:MAG TPA: N-acetyl-gamma-glutamyl-phosphate reductase, partial [Actinomycetes bacterium]|nr:N-acetyl-gamma-glutamyl-phosphate reductase [Actinomycetes bacterium]